MQIKHQTKNDSNKKLFEFFSVAPVATASYSKSFYESLNVPTMIVYGDKDLGLGLTSAKHLSDIPTATAPQILADSR